MYKNYIFDLYGTLVDINTDEDSIDLWDKMALFYKFKGVNYRGEELKSNYLRKIDLKRKSLLHTEYPDFQLSDIFKELFNDKDVFVSYEIAIATAQFFRILSISYVKLYTGIIEFLDELKKKKKKIYLLSNAQSIFTANEMKMLGIYDYFDGICFSADYCTCKPDKSFYNQLIEKYNLNVHESIMIGNDYLADILGAKAVGLDTLYIHSNLSPDIQKPPCSTYSIMDGNTQLYSKLLLK